MTKKSYISRERMKGMLGQILSPAFLIILLGSFLLWYMTKLSHEYTTEIPLNVRIDGQKYGITAVVSGRGSLLMAHKLSLRKVNLHAEELTMRRSKDIPGAMTITNSSLLKAISAKTGGLKVVQIVDAPDFIPEPEEPEEPSAKEPEKEHI